MTTITEDYVSYETAKLLKEKGFQAKCTACYHSDPRHTFELISGRINYCNPRFGKCKSIPPYNAPTLQMTMKWLRENYNIYISIRPDFPGDKDYKMYWCWAACILCENCISTKGHQCYIETYEEAAEAAIKYCLENLI